MTDESHRATRDAVADFRPQPILRILVNHEVDFLVIGGLAGVLHGSSYPTYDVDIAYSRDRRNLERLAAALRELGARRSGVDPELPLQPDAQALGHGANFCFDTSLGRLDVFAEPSGAPAYERLRAAAQQTEVDGVPVNVVSLDHLIAMKQAAGRDKDRLTVSEYIALADEIDGRRDPPAE